jgi:hypothetical protein
MIFPMSDYKYYYAIYYDSDHVLDNFPPTPAVAECIFFSSVDIPKNSPIPARLLSMYYRLFQIK